MCVTTGLCCTEGYLRIEKSRSFIAQGLVVGEIIHKRRKLSGSASRTTARLDSPIRAGHSVFCLISTVCQRDTAQARANKGRAARESIRLTRSVLYMSGCSCTACLAPLLAVSNTVRDRPSRKQSAAPTMSEGRFKLPTDPLPEETSSSTSIVCLRDHRCRQRDAEQSNLDSSKSYNARARAARGCLLEESTSIHRNPLRSLGNLRSWLKRRNS